MKQHSKNKMGLFMSTCLVAGTMIGSGIFLLPASLAAYGGISILGWGFTSIGAIFLALMLSRLSRLIPKTGGPYVYTKAGFGEFAGFLVGWGYWVSLLIGGAAIAVATVGYIGVFFPGLSAKPVFAAITALVIIWLFTAVNITGVRSTGVVQIFLTVLKILPLLLVIIAGALYFDGSYFQPFNASGESGFSAVTATGTLTLWAFLGVESASVAAENVENPEINVAKATIYGTLVAAVIYILSTVAVMGLLPNATLANSTAPFADAVGLVWGPGGKTVIAFGAIIACLGALNGLIFVQGRMPFALARDHLLAKPLARLSKSGTPVNALWLSGVFITIFMLLNYTKGLVELFTFLILLSTLSILLPFAFSAMAEIMLIAKHREKFSKPLRLKNTILAICAFAYSMWAIAGSGEKAVFWGLLLFMLGIPVYVLFKFKFDIEERFPED